MALKKSIETRFGVNAEYWNIENFNQHKTQRTINIILAGYASKEAKEESHSPIDTRNYTVSNWTLDEYLGFDVLDASGSNHIKKAYEYIKNHKTMKADSEGIELEIDSEFYDALDV